MLLEICASNYQSSINAQNAGAHRIELCCELSVGGLTPSYGLIQQVMNALKIPVFVLIRPRSGNFTYTNDEFEIMMRDIQLCKDLDCAGIVSGILNVDNTVDIQRTKELLEHSKPLVFTFHRAFDWTPNPLEAMETLIQLNVDRILTSGQEPTAEKGLQLLNVLRKKADNRIIILPGSGINTDNVAIFKNSGFTEIHTSATNITNINTQPKVPMNSPKFFDETIGIESDYKTIKNILNKLKHDE
jgi:copper homeostasis protein